MSIRLLDFREQYVVIYTNKRRTAWKQIDGPNIYIEIHPSLPQQLKSIILREGEYQELSISNRRERMQEQADRKAWYQEEGLAQEELVIGHIYEVIINQGGDLIIRDVLELYYQELLVTGGDKQLIINIIINRVMIRVLINFRVIGNYIILLVVIRLNIQT